MIKNNRAILCAYVIALFVKRGGVVATEKCLKKIRITDHFGVKCNFYAFSMAGVLGLIIFAVVIMTAVRMVKRVREKKEGKNPTG